MHTRALTTHRELHMHLALAGMRFYYSYCYYRELQEKYGLGSSGSLNGSPETAADAPAVAIPIDGQAQLSYRLYTASGDAQCQSWVLSFLPGVLDKMLSRGQGLSCSTLWQVWVWQLYMWLYMKSRNCMLH